MVLAHHLRSEHVAIVGKTGTGKSSLLRYFLSQDIAARKGFVCIDLHGDLTPFVISEIAAREKKTGIDLSDHLLIIDPTLSHYSAGLNPLECMKGQSRSVLISEIVSLLRLRWNLDHFGARTEELLRNALWVLSENNLTLLEISPLLTNTAYRSLLLKKITNPEVNSYFENRYNRASEAMQSVMREAVLNKVTAFTVDPGLRHIVGQAHSTFSIKEVMDEGKWMILNLPKGRLGDNALTFAGLFLTKLKNSIFARRRRNLFTIYADELPNLVAVDDTFGTLLSEARKFAISVVTANQFLNQLTPQMRSTLLSVGTTLCFQLSAEDAPILSRALDGEKSLSRRLTTLAHRHFITRLHGFPEEGCVPTVKKNSVQTEHLTQRSLRLFGELRERIEQEINARTPKQETETLEGWR